MIEFINQTGKKKPELEDTNDSVKTLATEWVLFAGLGFHEEAKKEYYTKIVHREGDGKVSKTFWSPPT